MASITKRGNTFRIKVFVGNDMNGKQLIKSTTFIPPQGVTPKKAEKLAQEYAFEFERHCKGYSQLDENMRFSELADWYFANYAPQELKESTIYTYMGAIQKPYKACSRQYKDQRHQRSQINADHAILSFESCNGKKAVCHYSEYLPPWSAARLYS